MDTTIVSYGGAATIPTTFPLIFNRAETAWTPMECSIEADRVKNLIHKPESEENSVVPRVNLKTHTGALYCRSGTWLEILGDDEPMVHGTAVENSKFSIVEFISIAMGLVSIRGVESQHFACLDANGSLYATPAENFSSECIFIEEMMENYYNVYSSCVHGTKEIPWYMEFRRSGRPRKGPMTRKRRKASHFLVIHYDGSNYLDSTDMSSLVVASLIHRPPSYAYFKPKPKPVTHRVTGLRARVEAGPNAKKKEKKKKKKKEREENRDERLYREEKRRRERQEELERMRAIELRRIKQKPKIQKPILYNSYYPPVTQRSYPKYYRHKTNF